MNFECPASLERQEKEPTSIAEWVEHLAPGVRVELVENIDGEAQTDGRKTPAAYCFDGEDPAARKNERIEIDRETNEAHNSPLGVAAHELRHREQWESKAQGRELELLTAKQVKELVQGYGSYPDWMDTMLQEVGEKPREVDAVLFAFLVERGVRLKLIAPGEISGLMQKDAAEIIALLRDRWTDR